MSDLGNPDNPLRVAVIGSGPAGFYTVSELLKHTDLSVRVDMFDQLPSPFGLVRYGVAPDHPKDKSVTRTYDKTARHSGYRFFGNVRFGDDLSLADLQRHYHQIVFATGTQTDRRLGIPGEDLHGNHSAAEFVAWYNGHPDFADRAFDFDCKSVAVVGMGNVALDVARIFCRTYEELAQTDIADYALHALRNHQITDVHVLGRRGPAQAAFTPPEIRELEQLTDTAVLVAPEEATLDAISAAFVAEHPNKNTDKNIACIQRYATNSRSGARRAITLRFFVSPVEMTGDAGRLQHLKLVKNEPSLGSDGSVRAKPTGITETLSVGMVFRSVGYRGVALPGIPFDEKRGLIRNRNGRVVDATGDACKGLYTAGWIKRGPSGVIGTNKTCARETVACMLEDVAAGDYLQAAEPGVEALDQFVQARCNGIVSYPDWQLIDEAEIKQGIALARPRVKFTSAEAMLAALDKSRSE